MSPAFGDGRVESRVVVLSAECRALRRALRPLVWVTLEEVALDAVAEDGRLVARTSARHIAERLGVDPGTAAAALGDLRRRGLVVLEREKGPAGRFGLSVYELGLVAGLSVIEPCGPEPCTAMPCAATPNVVTPGVDTSDADPSDDPASGTTADSGSLTVASRADSYSRRGHHAASASLQCPGQEALDLGSVSS